MKKILLFLIVLIYGSSVYSQDLSVKVTDYKDYYVQNINNVYSIIIKNTGTTPAVNVHLVANIPAGIESFNWVGPDGDDGTGPNPDLEPDNGNDNIDYIIPAIAPGEVMTVIVTMGIPSYLQGNLIFQANIDSPTPDPNMANNESTDIDQKGTGVDIEVINTNNQTTFVPGTTSSYTVKVTNKGPLEATNVAVSNAVPAGVTNFTWSGNSVPVTAGALTNTITSLMPNASVTYNVSFTIPAAYADNTVVNQTTYTSFPTDQNTNCPQCTDTDVKLAGANLVVTNTDGQTTYTQGGTRIYTITVVNNGPEAAANVQVVNEIPFGITQFSWTGSNGSSGTNVKLDNTVSSLANGATITYTITLQIPSTFTGSLKSEAIVTSSTPDPVPGCTQCVDIDTLSTAGSADVVITNTDNQLAYVPGLPITYTVKVTNNGPFAATNVQVVNSIPAGITQFSWSGTNGTSGTNISLSDMIASMASAQSVTYTVTLQVPAGFTGPLRNEAFVASSSNDTNLANNQSVDIDNIAVGADVVIVNTNNQSTYVPGSTVVYTVTVTNNGPSNAINFTLTDTFSAGLGPFSWTSTNGGVGNNVNSLVHNIPTFTVGTSVVYTVTIQIPLAFTGNLVSTVTKSSPTPDPNTVCVACVDTDTRANADVAITNTNNQDTYIPGGTSVYTVKVTNNGPTIAENIAVSNAIPVGITQFSWTGSNGTSNTNTPLSDAITLAVGSSVTYTITMQIPLGYTGNLTSIATVNNAPTDSVVANNQATDTDTLATGADIVVVNTNGQSSYVPGTTATYTITVTNNGPSNATGVVVNNAAPAGTQFTWSGSNGSSGASAPLNNTIPTLTVGSTVTYTIIMQIPASQTGALTSTTTITSATTDPNTACQFCTDTDVLSSADVSVVLTDNSNFYTPGTTKVYKLTVTNNGPTEARNIQVSYLRPAGITDFDWTGSNATSGNDVDLTDAVTMASGEIITYTITMQIPAGFTGNLVNTANVNPAPTIGTADPVAANNTSVDTDMPYTGADIVVVNSDGGNSYVAGQTRTYNIRITNFGPSAATNVTVRDLVTSGVPTANVTWSGNNLGPVTGDLNDVIPTLAVGQTVTYTIDVEVPSGFPQASTLVNEVSVTSNTPDPNPGCAQCIDIDSPTPFADLDIIKTNNQDTFLLTRAVTAENPTPEIEYGTYTITVANNGPSDARNVNVVDMLPAGIAADKMKWIASDGTSGTGAMNSTIANLPAGEVLTFVVTIQIPTLYPDPNDANLIMNFINKVVVTSATTDPTPACLRCTDTDLPRPRALTVNSVKYSLKQLVEDVLIDSKCVTVTNFTSSPLNTIGYFHRNNSYELFPFESGVIIRNGVAVNTNGPYTGNNISSNGTGPGGTDAELQAINDSFDPLCNTPQGCSLMNDASFIKFHFKPVTADFSFNFLFAANEYGQWQCGYADTFAFILTDLDTGVMQNLAVIPGTDIPVQVTKIRDNAYNTACADANVDYFGNYYATTTPNNTAPINMRGRTIPMTASAIVVPGNNYSIKLIIADARDTQFDSAVFIEAGSFNLGEPDLTGELDDAFSTIITSGQATVCDDLTATLKAGNAASPFIQYQWGKDGVLIPGATDYFYDVTTSGTYYVNLTYGVGCSITKAVTLDFRPPLPLSSPIPLILPTITDCSPNGVNVFNLVQDSLILNGQSAFDYNIGYYLDPNDAKYDANAITDPANYNPAILEPTLVAPYTKTIYVAATNTNGCQEFSQFEIQAFANQGTMTYNNTNFCFGQTINIITPNPSANLTAGGYYEATPSPGLSINSTTGEIDILASTPGDYSVVYKIDATTVCPAFETSPAQQINIGLCSQIDDLADTCAGYPFNLTTSDAGPGAVYTWYEGTTTLIGTTTVPSFSWTAPTTSGTYSYQVIATIGTTASAPSPEPMIVNPIPVAVIAGPANVCTGQNDIVTITGTEGATVVYNDGTSNNPIIIPTGGVYQLNITPTAQTDYQIISVAGNTTPDCIQNITAGSPGSFLTVNVGLPNATITTASPLTEICAGSGSSFVISGTPNAVVDIELSNSAGTQPVVQVTLDATGSFTFQTGNLSVEGNNIFCLTKVTRNGTCSNPITGQCITVPVKAMPFITSFTSATTFVCAGATATYTVVGTADATINYNDGLSNKTLTLDNTGNGSFTVSSATLTSPMLVQIFDITTSGPTFCITTFTPPLQVSVDIYDLPAIVTNPVNNTLCPADTTVSFSATATGTNITYEWYMVPSTTPLVDGAHYSGATTNTLTINNPTSPADIGDYYVRVLNPSCGFDDSATAKLEIDAPTVINTQPTGGTICEGTPLTTITVAASGTLNLQYQWYFGTTAANLALLPNGGNISGANTTQLSIANITAANAGFYQCWISNNCPGVTKTDIVQLEVTELPEVTAQSNDVVQCSSDATPVVLNIQTNNVTGVTYRWFKNSSTVALTDGANISGATTDTLTINPAGATDSGDYTCEITTACGTDTSNIVRVTIPQAPSIISGPVAVPAEALPISRCEGQFFTLQINVPPGYTLQWQHGGIDLVDGGRISGATTNTLNITSVQLADSGDYTCVVTGDAACAPLVSGIVPVIINAIPVIVQQPVSKLVCEGDNHTLTVGLQDTTGLTYQWQFNGVDLDGTIANVTGYDTAELTITAATAANDGNYVCVISSGCPDLLSAQARILIVPLPVATITTGIEDEICAGNSSDILFSGTPSAIVTYTVNAGAPQTITLNPSGTAVLITGILNETTIYQLVSVERNDTPSCPAALTGSATITVNPFPAVVLDQDGYICLDLITNQTTTYLLDTGLNPADYSFVWYFNNVATGDTGPSIQADQGGDYRVVVTDLVTLCTGFATAPIEVSSPPVTITATATTTFFADSGTIEVTVTPAGDYEYRLDNGPYQSDNVFNNVSSLSATTLGTHTVYARDLKACGELEFDVRIIDYPKYFTPNGDGYHDTWNISTLSEQSNAKIYIFDRFGKLVKQISTTGSGWDGTFNGKPLTADDYWFVIKYSEQGVNKEFKAHFSLKR